MSINWEWLRYIGILCLCIVKGVFGLFLIFVVFISTIYMSIRYKDVNELKQTFNQLHLLSLKTINILECHQKPLLQFRQKSGWNHYYVQSYHLNSSQIIKAEQYLRSIPIAENVKDHAIKCILPTTDETWLFPQFTRRYVGDLSSRYKNIDSFLVYGSAKKSISLSALVLVGNF